MQLDVSQVFQRHFPIFEDATGKEPGTIVPIPNATFAKPSSQKIHLCEVSMCNELDKICNVGLSFFDFANNDWIPYEVGFPHGCPIKSITAAAIRDDDDHFAMSSNWPQRSDP